jgi:nitrogen fixation protein NifU and related proteins
VAALDRQEQIELLLDHYRAPRHRGALPDPDVTMPGGNPGCGDIVTIYLKGASDHEHFAGLTFEGEGCTISQAAASMLMEMIHDGRLSMADVLRMDYNAMIEALGRDVVASRPRCATLALGTVKAAVKKYFWDHGIDPNTKGSGAGVGDESNGLVFGPDAAPPAPRGG